MILKESRGVWPLLCLLMATVAVDAQEPLPRVAPEAVGLAAPRLDQVTDLLEEFVAAQRIAGAVVAVARRGRLAYLESVGVQDLETGAPMTERSLFRIYSMTKAVTAIAAMILLEEGRFDLSDPVSDFLPQFGEVVVLKEDGSTRAPSRPIRVEDLFLHTAGLSHRSSREYREAGVRSRAITLPEFVDNIVRVPLRDDPGIRFRYSASPTVLGRLVEIWSGQPFDVFLRERIFEPLGMVDTGFFVPASKRDRLSRLYGHTGPERSLALGDTTGYTEAVTMFSGGGGLAGTAADYLRFAQMLLNGGELEGVRILGRKTIELMTVDHLGDVPTSWLSPGWGFGLGFTVRKQAGLDGMSGSVGEFYWFGVAGTSFWVDPVEELIGVFMIQIRPSRDIAFRNQFKKLVYQALIG